MRARKEIEDEIAYGPAHNQKLIIELLLDVREQNKEIIEILRKDPIIKTPVKNTFLNPIKTSKLSKI